jgi:hypothetical protein
MSNVLAEWVHPVEWAKVREFARAVQDPGGETEPPSVPPTFPVVLNAGFIEKMVVEVLKLDRARTVHGEQEYEYLRPLGPGDVVRCRARIVSDTRKQGKRGGEMRIVIAEIEMSDDATGEIIGYERSTAIETAPRT